MADESGYQSRIMPQAGAPMPMASPDAFGAQVGRAVGQLGEVAHRGKIQAREIELKIEADRQAAEVAKRLALQRQNMVGVVQHLRTNPSDLNYSTHSKQVVETLEAAREGLLDGITSREVRNRAEVQINEYAAELGSREEIFAQGKATARQFGNTVETLDIYRNEVRRGAMTPAEALKASYELTDGLQNVDPEGRKKLRDHADEGINTAYIQHLQDTNPTMARAILDSGKFDFLPPATLERLRGSTDMALRTEAFKVKEAALEIDRQKRDELKGVAQRLEVMGVMIDKGDPPAPSDIAAAIDEFRSKGGDPAVAVKYAYLAEDAGRARVFARMATGDLQARAAPLRQLQAEGQLGGAGERELDHIQRTLKARSETAGEELGALWKAGGDSQRQVIAQLHNMPRSERMVSAAKLGDRAAILGSLPPDASAAILHGNEVRKARGKDYLPVPPGEAQPSEAAARAAFDAQLGPMVSELGGAYDEMLDAALDLHAAWQERRGVTQGWNSGLFTSAVRTVFGGTKRPDGTEQGGLRKIAGHVIELPAGWSREEFETRYARYDFTKAGAFYGSGKPAQSADVRLHYRPVVEHEDDAGNLWYRFEGTDGAPLIRKDGKVFTMPVDRAPGAGR
ncbi:hypothetical protein [Novosphingobium sp.]|uniref:hypothetical protein n=1 Tax=Novosphingobium sp. TaxID=1874826 RepID=UPI00286E0F29|nr:hypothetical protein [Novosphingobium sp.]